MMAQKIKQQKLQKNMEQLYLNLKKNKGNGAAFKKGIERSTGEIIAQVDADSQFQPEEIPKLIEPLIKGEVDLTFCSHFLPESNIEKGVLSFRNRIAYYVDSYLVVFLE